MDHLFIGQIVHTKSLDEFEIFTKGFIAVQNGMILEVNDIAHLDEWLHRHPKLNLPLTVLTHTQFLMPGFIDCHIHAPQMPNIRLGLDKTLLDWLNTYTFPLEVEYKNNEFAQAVYEKVVKRTLNNGTTLAAYYATNYMDTSVILAAEAVKYGQRAFVGKTSSNCCSPDYYVETTAESIVDNIEFIQQVLDLKSDLVQPIMTPRSALTCDMELLIKLGHIAKNYNLNIQSHISENVDEIQGVQHRFKKEYAEIYDTAGLLTSKCILGHGVHLEDHELDLISKRNASIAHCPTSNYNLGSGLCDVKRIIEANIKVGLGTDVSGGCKASILCTMNDALSMSQSIGFVKKQIIRGSIKLSKTSDTNYEALNYKQALYLATLGGAEALSVDDKVGNFVKGKEFDAILVDTFAGAIDKFHNVPGGTFADKSKEQKLLELVQRFVYVGDDRNIKQVFVQGRQVKVQI